MKNVLPFEKHILRTSLSKEQVIEKLKESVEPEKSFGFRSFNFSYTKPYVGKINGDRFEIKRAINYRNSFLPLIKGIINNEIGRTKIDISMKPHDFVIAFMVIWFGGVTIGCIATTYVMLTQEFNPFLLIPFAMLLFGIALVVGAFKTESSKSRKDLLTLFEAEIEE
jgi:hypothetical protein